MPNVWGTMDKLATHVRFVSNKSSNESQMNACVTTHRFQKLLSGRL